VRAGDTVMMPAGTIHALGPGLLIYEVQQTSDLTYRVFDWNRPVTPQRPLHIEQSLKVANPEQRGKVLPLPEVSAPAAQTLAACPYFRLELLAVGPAPLSADTGGQSFHALTVISGECAVTCGAERAELAKFGTLLVSADSRGYEISAGEACRLLRASVPG